MFRDQQARIKNLKKAHFVEFCVFIICPRYEYFEFKFTNTYLKCQLQRSDDTAFGAGTFSWQEPVHSWKAGPGEVMTVENLYLEESLLWSNIMNTVYLHSFPCFSDL